MTVFLLVMDELDLLVMDELDKKDKFLIIWIVFRHEPFVYKVSFDHFKLSIRYGRFHNLLIDMQTC